MQGRHDPAAGGRVCLPGGDDMDWPQLLDCDAPRRRMPAQPAGWRVSQLLRARDALRRRRLQARHCGNARLPAQPAGSANIRLAATRDAPRRHGVRHRTRPECPRSRPIGTLSQLLRTRNRTSTTGLQARIAVAVVPAQPADGDIRCANAARTSIGRRLQA